mgnify:FL=1
MADKAGSMKRYPPVPADFPERMNATRPELCKHYLVHKDVISHWRKLSGYVCQYQTALVMPPEFAALADKMSLAALAARFKIGKITAAKWRKKLGINIAPCKPFVAPEGFVEFMAGHILAEAAAHYGASQDSIYRYCKRHNIPFARKPNTFQQKPFAGSWGKAKAAPLNQRSYGIHDEAVDLLRRYRWTVYRCDERGRQKDNGTLFRVGNVVCDGDELLVRADKYRRAVA